MVACKPGLLEFHLAYLDCLGHNLRFEGPVSITLYS